MMYRGRYFPTIGLGELVRNPFSRWVCAVTPQPQDLAAIVMQYQQSVEQSGMRLSGPRIGPSNAMGRRRDYEGTSSTPGTAVAFPLAILLCNGGLSDINAELEKLAMKPWCAP